VFVSDPLTCRNPQRRRRHNTSTSFHLTSNVSTLPLAMIVQCNRTFQHSDEKKQKIKRQSMNN